MQSIIRLFENVTYYAHHHHHGQNLSSNMLVLLPLTITHMYSLSSTTDHLGTRENLDHRNHGLKEN